MLTKVLFTPRLRLCPAGLSDRWELFELWEQPDVHHRLFGSSAPLALPQALARFERYARTPPGLWILRSPVSGHALGFVALQGAELSIAVAPDARRRGYATEAARALIHHAIARLDMAQFTAACDADNAAGLGLLQHLGFDAVADGDHIDYRLRSIGVVTAEHH